jgi:hypothetical protein
LGPNRTEISMVRFLEFRFGLVPNRKTEPNQMVRFGTEPFRGVSTIQILSAKRLDSESHSRFISSSDDQLRTELDLHAMTSNRDHYFDHHFDHHLMPERSQQARRRDD